MRKFDVINSYSFKHWYSKNANVNIRGLTAIAGYNGTGKSTIGKILFSCIGGVKSLLNRESGIVSENLDRYVWFVDSSIRILSNILNTISKMKILICSLSKIQVI